jgi:hypothetical protein
LAWTLAYPGIVRFDDQTRFYHAHAPVRLPAGNFERLGKLGGSTYPKYNKTPLPIRHRLGTNAVQLGFCERRSHLRALRW